MLSKPIQQVLACLLGVLMVSLVIVGILQPMIGAAEGQFARHQALQFEAQRIQRAVEANRSRSPEDLEALRAGTQTQLFTGGDINDAQGALQSLLSRAVQTSTGLLNSMRLGDTQALSNGLTAITLDVTATVPEEQLMGLLSTLHQAPQTLHIPKLSIQKKATYDDSDTQVTFDMRAIGYWHEGALDQESAR